MIRFLLGAGLGFFAGLLVGGYVVTKPRRATVATLPAAPISSAVEAPDFDLAGHWEATLPSGAKLQPVWSHLNGLLYRLDNGGVFNGIYAPHRTVLAMIEPMDKRLKEFVWQVVSSNQLRLIRSSRQTGADYTGTVLQRRP